MDPYVRFWKLVYKTDNCWFWIGAVSEKGYGKFYFDGKSRRAHRVAFLFTYGFWPNKDLMHSCDTPACVRPDHLGEGTHLENHQDSARKGVNPNLARMHKKRCSRGHLRTPENINITSQGAKECRRCKKILSLRRSLHGRTSIRSNRR